MVTRRYVPLLIALVALLAGCARQADPPPDDPWPLPFPPEMFEVDDVPTPVDLRAEVQR